MTLRAVVFYFLWVLGLAFVVTAAVTFLYNFVVHGAGVVEWGTALHLGLILGIFLSWVRFREQTRET